MNIPTADQLISSIEAFLERHSMAPTRFGKEATGEPQLIASIRNGRSPSLAVCGRLAEFMRIKDVEAGHLPPDTAAARSLSERNEDEFTPLDAELPLRGSYREPELPVIGVAA